MDRLLAVANDPATRSRFREFCYYERAVGGPDPHMATVGYLASKVSLAEKFWRAGCYIGVYNVPTAERIWQAFPWPQARDDGPALEPWLREHWAGIATRRERRSVRRPGDLARFLREYAQFAEEVPRRRWFEARPGAYEEAWQDCQRVHTLGRYVALKLLEFYRRYCGLSHLAVPDIRPRGGWSPRQGLVLLYPQHAAALLGDDRPEHLALANGLAEQAREALEEQYDRPMTRYEMQVLLCDSKQALVGLRQFPGRSLDSEIAYHDEIAAHWGTAFPTDMWKARAALFPERALGERRGWRRVRKELGRVIADYGYTWSDLRFDYTASLDLSHPVRWAAE